MTPDDRSVLLRLIADTIYRHAKGDPENSASFLAHSPTTAVSDGRPYDRQLRHAFSTAYSLTGGHAFTA